MNQTPSAEKPRRQSPPGALGLTGAGCLPEADLWMSYFPNLTKRIDSGRLPYGYFGDGPADGPYPSMFVQRCLN
jgi:hypothetical protein